jgi:hypothetical protein
MRASIDASLAELQPAALRRGNGRRIAGWIALRDGVDPKCAARHLAGCMLHRRNGCDFLLRLHDPAVMWALWTLLPVDQRAALLGPIGTWLLLDPQGQPTNLSPPNPVETVRLALTEAQWIDVDNLAAIHGMFRRHLNQLSAKGSRADSALNVAARALRRARAAGIHLGEDLALFAEHAVLVHPRFDSHPAVKPVLQASLGATYSAAAEALTAEEWTMIANELYERAAL